MSSLDWPESLKTNLLTFKQAGIVDAKITTKSLQMI